MIAYKFLKTGGLSAFTGFRWPSPAGGSPGPWVEAGAELAQCRSGIHACRIADLPYWLEDELWAAEVDGAIEEDAHQVVAQRARLLWRVEAWTADVAWELAESCTLRARDLACRALRESGLGAEADGFQASSSPEALERTGVVAYEAALAADDPVPARVTCAALTAARHILWGAGRPDYVTYAAFSAYCATVAADTVDRAGYAEERTRQAAWLAERLGL